MPERPLIDYDSLETDLEGKVERYQSSQPFPHIVLDDVLTGDVFKKAVAEFPDIRDESWKGYLHVNETKYSNAQPETCGIEGLIPDWSMDGGGLHQTLRGGHLNIHADFTTHHVHANWARRVNILLYLNEEWRDEWGGKLELWDKDMTACQARVTPAGNRMLIFTTSHDSFHGHPDGLTCPEDIARRSMALYYFTVEDKPIRRSTNYQARPEEGWLKKAAITADRTALDLYDRAKRRLGISDESIQGLMLRLERLRGKPPEQAGGDRGVGPR
jgi:hypothetical protein